MSTSRKRRVQSGNSVRWQVQPDYRDQVLYLVDQAAPPGDLRALVVPFCEADELIEQIRAAVAGQEPGDLHVP